MEVIYSAISSGHDMTKLCSHFTYLHFVSKKRDSAHENVGGSGSGKCLLCQWLVHQSHHELTPPLYHGCPLGFIISHWSLWRRDQGGHPRLMSSLLRLQIGSGLLDQFKSCFFFHKIRVFLLQESSYFSFFVLHLINHEVQNPMSPFNLADLFSPRIWSSFFSLTCITSLPILIIFILELLIPK